MASLVIVVSAVLVLSRGQTVGDPNNAQTLLSTASTIDAFKHLNRYASEEKKHVEVLILFITRKINVKIEQRPVQRISYVAI